MRPNVQHQYCSGGRYIETEKRYCHHALNEPFLTVSQCMYIMDVWIGKRENETNIDRLPTGVCTHITTTPPIETYAASKQWRNHNQISFKPTNQLHLTVSCLYTERECYTKPSEKVTVLFHYAFYFFYQFLFRCIC